MNAHAFRHFYDYHFAENRKIWYRCVPQLSQEQFTQKVDYSHGSVRDQIVHLISADDTWFCGLRGVDIPEPLNPADFHEPESIRAHWDNVAPTMRDYLGALRDDMLFKKPFPDGEDKDLILWQALLHVANHGTDHRAQLLRLLNDLGVRTEYQDYVFYAYGNVIQTPQAERTTKSELLKWLQDEYRNGKRFSIRLAQRAWIDPA